MTKKLNIALVGLGTVGGSTAKMLIENKALYKARTGCEINLAAVSSLNESEAKDIIAISNGTCTWYPDARTFPEREDIDLIIELIGGKEGFAKNLVTAALKNGKHVVTANKDMMAHSGFEIAKLAEENGVSIGFEASVGGGIPMLKTVREALGSDQITKLNGIINGTCNYILTEMEKTGDSFKKILKDAQDLGYAEADPSFDVDGMDTAHKIKILASMAFGVSFPYEQIFLKGIREISGTDIGAAKDFGYKIKLLGSAEKIGNQIHCSVAPHLVHESTPLAGTSGVFNALNITGKFVDEIFVRGRGAGGDPTATAVVADVIDIARGVKPPAFAIPVEQIQKINLEESLGNKSQYYVRFTKEVSPYLFTDLPIKKYAVVEGKSVLIGLVDDNELEQIRTIDSKALVLKVMD
ncbi:MAG: homoserine dehydrogenase [Alphaproteobacteria bacterium]